MTNWNACRDVDLMGWMHLLLMLRFNEVWKKDFGMRPINCIYYSICNCKNSDAHSIRTHTHTNPKGRGLLEHISWWRENREFALPPALAPLFVSLLPPSFGEDNDGASAAFEGCFDRTDGYCLWGVSSELGMSPQLFKQLPVEGSRLGLSCYLSPEWPRGEGEGFTFNHTKDAPLHNHSLCWERLTPLCSSIASWLHKAIHPTSLHYSCGQKYEY